MVRLSARRSGVMLLVRASPGSLAAGSFPPSSGASSISPVGILAIRTARALGRRGASRFRSARHCYLCEQTRRWIVTSRLHRETGYEPFRSPGDRGCCRPYRAAQHLSGGRHSTRHTPISSGLLPGPALLISSKMASSSFTAISVLSAKHSMGHGRRAMGVKPGQNSN